MPTLHVRNVPTRTYGRLRKMAASRNRSLSAEVLTLLDRAVTEEDRHLRRSKLLGEMLLRVTKLPPGAPQPEDLIREDRER